VTSGIGSRVSGAGWREEFEAVSESNFDDARNLLLLGSQHADFLEESFEACRGQGEHQSAGGATDTAVAMGHIAWGKDGCPRMGGEGPAGAGEFVFAFQDLEGFVFAMMHVRGWAFAGLIVGFQHAHDAGGITSMEADEDGATQDID